MNTHPSQNLPFATRLERSIIKNNSVLCAGFDPTLESLPGFLLARGEQAPTSEEAIARVLSDTFSLAAEALQGLAPVIKPNIAFFEQYGIGGLRAFQNVLSMARERGFLTIADIKRGDIASTGQAYSTAFLGAPTAFGKPIEAFACDAVTINPYLGFDTLETFLKDGEERGKGVFVLVRTSNPGSGSMQGLRIEGKGSLVCEEVAAWLALQASRLAGSGGRSGVGAVVGATYPDELARLRELMPKNYFLIPGLGAQGGTAHDTAKGFTPGGFGAVVNASRGLFVGIKDTPDERGFVQTVKHSAEKLRSELEEVRTASQKS